MARVLYAKQKNGIRSFFKIVSNYYIPIIKRDTIEYFLIPYAVQPWKHVNKYPKYLVSFQGHENSNAALDIVWSHCASCKPIRE
jgi:hypothetical protein